MALEEYQRKRRFAETPEPRPRVEKKDRHRFVVQKHRASHLHFDFRLEMEGVLKSWAVPKGPSYDPAVKRLAMMTEDHPYAYASFEGVIPAGNYGAGNVIVWDNGGWEFIEPGDDPVKALKSGKLTFRLYGKKMFGEWALVKIKGRYGDKGNEWLLLKHRDEFASETVDITEVAPRSIVSNKDVDEIGGENTWESNRKASPRRAPTLADKLAPAKGAKRRVRGDATKAPAPRARAASSRSRNSPARPTRKAAPTRRRRPR